MKVTIEIVGEVASIVVEGGEVHIASSPPVEEPAEEPVDYEDDDDYEDDV